MKLTKCANQFTGMHADIWLFSCSKARAPVNLGIHLVNLVGHLRNVSLSIRFTKRLRWLTREFLYVWLSKCISYKFVSPIQLLWNKFYFLLFASDCQRVFAIERVIIILCSILKSTEST